MTRTFTRLKQFFSSNRLQPDFRYWIDFIYRTDTDNQISIPVADN